MRVKRGDIMQKVIKLLIKWFLPGFHLSKNPTKKHKVAGFGNIIGGAGELSSVGLKGDGARGKQ